MIILDSSAVLAVLFEEEGGAQVARRARGAVIGAVNHCEVLSKLIEEGVTTASGLQSIERLRLDVRPFDATQSEMAASLRPPTRHLGLSLGDRACLALAKMLGGPVLTGDRRWAELDVGVEIELIR